MKSTKKFPLNGAWGRGLGGALFAILTLSGCPAASDGDGADKAEKSTEQAAEKSDKSASDSKTESGLNQTMLAQLEKGFALPQEAMKGKDAATTIKGEVVIEGYQEGLIQIDITKAADGPQKPVTNLRLEKPGPFEIYVPKNLGKTQITAILDIKKDGPGREDPRGEPSENPLTIKADGVEGLVITIDMANIQSTPPLNQPPQPVDPNAPKEAKGVDNISDDEGSEIFLSPDGK